MRHQLVCLAVAAALTLALVLTGCGQASTTIAVTGRVSSDDLAVQAPMLNVPRVSLDAGFQVSPGASATTSTVPALLSLGAAQRVSAINARLGDQVKAGDVLVRFDDAALAAQLRIAKADAAVAKAQLGVIDAAIDTTHEKEDDLLDTRREVLDGIARATKVRRGLVVKLAQARKAAAQLPKQLATVERNLRALRSKRAEVEEQLAQVTAALAALPPDAPPELREPLLQAQQQLTAAQAQLKAGIAKLITARGKLTAAIAQLRKGMPQLTKAIVTIDANLAKARDGLRKIDRGLRTLRDARADLKRSRKLAVIAARDTTAVDAATSARARAVVRAPADGVVTAIATVGDVVAPGATVARIARPAVVVTTWLAPEQVAQVCVDDPATVTLDSLAAPASGRVSRILPLASYPPSYHTTDQVHLTRAVPVEITVATALPPGVPADIQFSPCRTTR